jgi:hypothetical protein
MSSPQPHRQIRAVHDERTVRVYQAFGDEIADTALSRGTFVSPPFSMSRMTWIKPSFLWMMYRSGWGAKDKDQQRILAIDISREGLAWALQNSCPSHPEASMTQEEWRSLKVRSPVRIQWDPERDLQLAPLPYRSLQVGLSGQALERYVNEWIQQITEVTALAHAIHGLVCAGELGKARELLPRERPYPAAAPCTGPGSSQGEDPGAERPGMP